MPAMRLTARKGNTAAPGQAQIPAFVVCPVCHLRNDVTARFCRDCGLPLGAPRDPVRGTTTRRAELPSDRGAGIAAVLSLAAIVVLAGIAGFLVFRGFESASTAGASASSSSPPIAAAASGLPMPSVAPRPSVDANPPSGPTEDPGGLPTTEPTEDPGGLPTDVPVDEPTTPPLSTRTGWTCGDAAIQRPAPGALAHRAGALGTQDAFDRLTFDLTRLDGEARRGVIVRMEFLKPARAASRYDMDTPDGDRAIVLTFDGAMNIREAVAARPGLVTLASVEAQADDEGVVHALVGINGDGCARLVANDWRNGSAETTEAKLVIDIRR